MDAYIYQAALLCDDCGEIQRQNIEARWLLVGDGSEHPNTKGSDDWPHGPYGGGGGEADSPQHCDHCQIFLENPLTGDGEAYVIEAGRQDRRGCVYRVWRDFYDYLFEED